MPTNTYQYTGAWAVFQVPNGVTSLLLDTRGAGSSGQAGGRVTGFMAVAGGQLLYILVGGAGRGPSGITGGAATVGGGGAGGNGYNLTGGNSGGGCTQIRQGATNGAVRALGGGAGGDGVTDGGAAPGGNGGGGNGGGKAGGRGGTVTAGGAGGVGTSGAQFAGANGGPGAGGRGGSTGGANGGGGGGGGGGYYGGGGGNGSSSGFQIAGGGGGGSNQKAGITGGISTQGGGMTGNGMAQITWTTPVPANQRPLAPAFPGPTTGTVTRSVDVDVSGVYQDPEHTNGFIICQLSTTPQFTSHTDNASPTVAHAQRAYIHYRGLQPNTHYFYRLYGVDGAGAVSATFSSGDFITNRSPLAPIVATPVDGATLNPAATNSFTWAFTDPDNPGDSQSQFDLDYRPIGSQIWQTHSQAGTTGWGTPPSTFSAGQAYEWRVRSYDAGGLVGPYSAIYHFQTIGTTTPPRPLTPVQNEGLVVQEVNRFTWKFIDFDSNDHQTGANFRYRPVGVAAWTTVFGVATTSQFWDAPADTFTATLRYEWQVATIDTTPATSDWSASLFFYAIDEPGGAVQDIPPVDTTQVLGALGSGDNRVFVYDRGGQRRMFELLQMSSISWNRKRDDISNALVTTERVNGVYGDQLGQLRSMRHELVIFRDGLRVWEGPITRITYNRDSVQIEAKDVWQYVYRRVMRSAYNDSYPNIKTVVQRAAKIIVDAMARDDPNVLAYLTRYDFPDDSQESRTRVQFQMTAWEEVDDLAENAGLDYTAVGRRLILNDVHRAIGQLPVMGDNDFADPPIVTEYGQGLGTFFAVTDNNGNYGVHGGKDPYYGWVEMLASSYGENPSEDGETQTPAALAALEVALASQAQRNSSGSYPAPVIVRVPDNTSLNPSVNVGINQLVPGVWIPLRSTSTPRTVTQMQKLDSMSVTQDSSGEKVAVVLSPAPGFGINVDALAALATDV